MAITNIFGRDFYQGTDAEMAACVPRIDGALFWTTDTLKLYCYSGAAWNEVGGGGGGDVATDAIWDAKGDLAVGTGADTAAKLTVGADGKIIYADSGEATGLVWDDPPAVATDAIWDAKGDLAAGTGANTAAKLTVGADGKMLYADSGEATGLKWDDPPAGADVATDAIWDAKGDLAVGTGANTASKLAVGADGKMLYADSGEATGLKWDDAPAAGGDSTLTSTYAARAAASNDGNLFLPSDGFVVERDTGAAYVPWGPLFPMTAPPAAGWSWVNQGTATVSTTNGGYYFTCAAAAAIDIKLYLRNIPAAPYTVTIGFLPRVTAANNHCGLSLRESSSGKLVDFFVLALAGHPFKFHATNYAGTGGAAVSDYFDFTPSSTYFGVVWLQLQDDNAGNRNFKYSVDGQNFYQIFTHASNTYIVPDQIGIELAAQNATYGVGMTVLSWKEA